MKLLTIIGMLCLGFPSFADDDLRKLTTADQANAWSGVGRLNIRTANANRFCSGALISDKYVLTAAHCVVDLDTGRYFSPASIKFLAGWRDGLASAYGQARRVVVHKDYSPTKRVNDRVVSTDIAIVELATPMNANWIKPFERQSQPSIGEALTVVSYAHGRADAPSLQQECHVLKRKPRVIYASCAVNFGASGAPIFVVKDGKPMIASVVSAMANIDGKNISLGVSLEEPLDELLRQLSETSGVFQSKKPGKSLAEQLGRVKSPE